MESDLQLRHDAQAQRYEAVRGDAVLGTLAYRTDDSGELLLEHTIVEPEQEGQGVGSFLIGQTLAQARKDGRKVVPACSFVAAWLRHHPDDAAALVRPDVRRQLDV